VGASSKAAGSGKIGRKGIGFKSVFQVSDRPMVVSPPFQFCFDTAANGVFGYIVPSWVGSPAERLPHERHRRFLRRLFPSSSGDAAAEAAASDTGTLLVCPMAARVKGLDLMKDLNFDGLALAFLKNLEKITFASVKSANVAAAAGGEGGSAGAQEGDDEGYFVGGNGRAGVNHDDDADADDAGTTETTTTTSSHEYRVEKNLVFEHFGGGGTSVGDDDSIGLEAVLKGVTVVRHRLEQCTIVESVTAKAPRGDGDPTTAAAAATTTTTTAESRRRFRLHNYTIHKYKKQLSAPSSSLSSSSSAPATTVISLAFPVSDDWSPLRSEEGELVFAYLPVTAAGFGFAIHADFELVASRQDVSDSHSGACIRPECLCVCVCVCVCVYSPFIPPVHALDLTHEPASIHRRTNVSNDQTT
jgi:hypothetical protein